MSAHGLPMLLNMKEAARQLGGVSIDTVRRLVRKGAFPIVKIGRRSLVPAIELAAWVAQSSLSTNGGSKSWESTNAVKCIGLTSQRQTASEYGKLLALPTAVKPKSITTARGRSAGG